MSAVSKIANVATIAGAGVVGYNAYKLIRTSFKDRNMKDAGVAVVMVLVAYAAVRYSFDKLNE